MQTIETLTIEKPKRQFLPENFQLIDWESLQPYYENLIRREINNLNELKTWLNNRDELDAYLSENLAWRYINYTRDTNTKENLEAFEYFMKNISPKTEPYTHKLNMKFLQSPYIKELDTKGYYKNYIRIIENETALYREENIPLNTQSEMEARKFSSISGAMTVEIDGKELTLQQAAKFLQNPDRVLRKSVFETINNRRIEDKEKLNEVLENLIKLRHQMALNAGFENFRDYKHKELARFDYSVDDVKKFHNSIKLEIVPLVEKLNEIKKKNLELDSLKPYDDHVSITGSKALEPFKDSNELVSKTIKAFAEIKPEFGSFINTMDQMKHLDLESRKGKAPGGYNYPLNETGAPFIFMNATGKFNDLVTMVHEGGHAVHSFYTRGIRPHTYKSCPSEVAELASMSMELIAMDQYHQFFKNDKEVRKAKLEHLEHILRILPWTATVDSFQHWLYENSGHTDEERKNAWIRIFDEYAPANVNWDEYENFKSYSWQKQLHIYEVPFYYIEYGIAQLGAIAVWKNYSENPSKGLDQYINALKLGYTKPIPEIYETAGIKFDFSRDYIHELAGFVNSELEKLL